MTNQEREIYEELVGNYGYDEDGALDIITDGRYYIYSSYEEYGSQLFFDYNIGIDAPDTYIKEAVEESIDYANFGKAMANRFSYDEDIIELSDGSIVAVVQ